MTFRPPRRPVRAMVLAVIACLSTAAYAEDRPTASDPLPVRVEVTLDTADLQPQWQAIHSRLDTHETRLADLDGHVADLRDQVTLLAAAGPVASPGGPSHQRPRPLVGINVAPPSADSTNWVFGNLLLQAEFRDGNWHAFTGAATRDADYPRGGFIIEPDGAATVTDTGDGLLIDAPSDAREQTIRVHLPGSSPHALFHPTYLQRLEPFGILRFAGWLNMDNTGSGSDGASATASDEAEQSPESSESPDLRRVAESILLANANGASPWYCIDRDWSEQDVRRMALMVRRGLASDRPIYLEWSNEPWKARGGQPLDRFIEDWATKAQETFDIWRDVFSDQPQRIVRVLSGPIDDVAVTEALAAEVGKGEFDAIACDGRVMLTPQNGPMQRMIRSGLVEAKRVLSLLDQYVEASGAKYERYAELATQYETPLLAYAAGPQVVLTDSRWREAGLEIQRHPDLYAVVMRHAQQWRQAQVAADMPADLRDRGVMVFSSDVKPLGDDGAAGHLEYQDQPLARAPRYRAIADLARQPRLAQRIAPRRPEGWTPPPANRGWTELTPSLDTRVIYVSTSTGSDRNNGLSPQTPVRTADRGYELVRDGHPDWLLFKRGDIFSLPTSNDGLFRRWRKSGRSRTEPMVVSSYGEPAEPMPQFHSNGRGFLHIGRGNNPVMVQHVIFHDLHALANQRKPDHHHFVDGGTTEFGILLRTDVHDLKFEGVRIEYFWHNILASGRSSHGEPKNVSDLTFHRCVIRNAWTSKPNHPQGFSATDFAGLRLTENIFDHNGWLEGHPEQRTVFRHQAYLQHMKDVLIEGNVFSRESFLALKVRSDHPDLSSDIVIRDNLFVDNLLPIEVGGDSSGDIDSIVHERIAIHGNVMTRVGGWISDVEHGLGLHVAQADDLRIEDNLLVHHVPSTADNKWPAIRVNDRRPNGDVVVARNIIHAWNTPRTDDPVSGPATTIEGNLVELSPDAYVDADRTIEGYAERFGDGRPLMAQIIEQRLHHWDEVLTARSINDWFREGFTKR